MIELDERTVNKLIAYVDDRVRANGCDDTFRFSQQWAGELDINWDSLLDALEEHGAYCDCEVVLNLIGPVQLSDERLQVASAADPWLLPPDFSCNLETIDRVLVARDVAVRNNHALDGEWVIPAPVDAKPKKRVRKSVHYFVGLESGLPTEIAFVSLVDPMPLQDMVERIRKSSVPEFKSVDSQVVGFIAKKIANLKNDAPVGAAIADRVRVGSKHQELNIHRVVMR